MNEDSREKLRSDITKHLDDLGIPSSRGGDKPAPTKDAIRSMHRAQRVELYDHERSVFGDTWAELTKEFADGAEVEPNKIDPWLEKVDSSSQSGDLFRFASLLWSIPVSKGFGRRMRYLVRDRQNGKLVGLFAIGDPVFNLSARDEWIGWDVEDRKERLVNVMDAYVVGAVPPYSTLLGGKLVTSLIGSAEVGKEFEEKYNGNIGIISKKRKGAHLALVTVTSALGRSSMYNRLRLRNQAAESGERDYLVRLVKIGATKGYGHFQLSNGLFDRLRELLNSVDHPYADGHRFGEGPNWRIRVIRAGLEELCLDPQLVRHGVSREVYAMPLAANFRKYLRGDVAQPLLNRPSLAEISRAALERWVIPRARRRPIYKDFKKEEILELIRP